MENALKSTGEDFQNNVGLKGPRPMMNSSGHNLLETAGEFATKFKKVSSGAMRETVTFAKEYPVHTAIGAAAIGFFAGFMLRGGKR